MDKCLYQYHNNFSIKILIQSLRTAYSAAGKPKKISNYQVFCATMYILRTGVGWRDLPNATDTGIAFI